MPKEWDMKYNAKNLSYMFTKFLQFSPKEIRAMIITILIMTFIVAFNDGQENFDLTLWMLNFLQWLLIVTSSFFVFVLAQRAWSLYEGYLPEYKLWWYGLMFGLIVAFVTRGHIWLLLPGGMMFKMSPIFRTGEFRHGQNVFLFSKISMFGPFAALFFAMAFKTLEVWFGISVISEAFVHRLFLFNMALAAYSLLPIPPLPGSKIFFESRLVYALIFGSFAGYAILVLFNIYSLIFALLIGVVVWAIFYIFFEKEGWQFD
jgi:hypothetical protein